MVTDLKFMTQLLLLIFKIYRACNGNEHEIFRSIQNETETPNK